MEFKAKIFGIKSVEKANKEIMGDYGLNTEDLSSSIEMGKKGEVLVITGTCSDGKEVKKFFRDFCDLDFHKAEVKIYFYKTEEEQKMSYDPYDFMERRHSKMLW